VAVEGSGPSLSQVDGEAALDLGLSS
jgi:hypothetical protein